MTWIHNGSLQVGSFSEAMAVHHSHPFTKEGQFMPESALKMQEIYQTISNHSNIMSYDYLTINHSIIPLSNLWFLSFSCCSRRVQTFSFIFIQTCRVETPVHHRWFFSLSASLLVTKILGWHRSEDHIESLQKWPCPCQTLKLPEKTIKNSCSKYVCCFHATMATINSRE